MADSASMNESYLQRVGLAVDESLNVVLLNGRPDETVSKHTAVAAREGKKWACQFCRLLDVVVERGHCDKQFDGLPTTVVVSIRAAIAFASLSLPVFGIYALVEKGFHLLGFGG